MSAEYLTALNGHVAGYARIWKVMDRGKTAVAGAA